MPEHLPKSAQATGNAVLDSVVNVMLCTDLLTVSGRPDYQEIKRLHALFCELYEQEPRRQTAGERKSLRAPEPRHGS